MKTGVQFECQYLIENEFEEGMTLTGMLAHTKNLKEEILKQKGVHVEIDEFFFVKWVNLKFYP